VLYKLTLSFSGPIADKKEWELVLQKKQVEAKTAEKLLFYLRKTYLYNLPVVQFITHG
jgi:hypothetical protein